MRKENLNHIEKIKKGWRITASLPKIFVIFTLWAGSSFFLSIPEEKIKSLDWEEEEELEAEVKGRKLILKPEEE